MKIELERHGVRELREYTRSMKVKLQGGGVTREVEAKGISATQVEAGGLSQVITTDCR